MEYLPIFIGGLKGWQLIIIVLVILLLFGGRRIPEFMRGMGRGVKYFKQGLDEAKRELNDDTLDKDVDHGHNRGDIPVKDKD